MNIPFSKPYITGKEIVYLQEVMNSPKLSGDGEFTKKCEAKLQEYVGSKESLLTHSCTAALEMAAILIDTQPGDEIIMPSFTFVSTANAFVLRGATPIFVDIRPDTFNIDETKIEAAITPKTKAIVPVHYAGVGCEMDSIMEIAKRHNLYVIEDAAQGMMASYKSKALGSMGHLGCLSFHDTKNIIAGEGGALLINDDRFIERAHILREKGTNRRQFLMGEVDKYTWQDIGSSYIPSELSAAFLLAQLESASDITQKRLQIWNYYQKSLKEYELNNLVQCPKIPDWCQHNAHIYEILMPTGEHRNEMMQALKKSGINTTFHYIPLHQAPYIKKTQTKYKASLDITINVSNRLVRLPLWIGMEKHLEYIIENCKKFII